MWGRINIPSLGDGDLVLTKNMLNCGLDNMLLECKTSVWHDSHPERVLVCVPTGLHDGFICLLKARRTNSSCIREKSGRNSLWPNHPQQTVSTHAHAAKRESSVDGMFISELRVAPDVKGKNKTWRFDGCIPWWLGEFHKNIQHWQKSPSQLCQVAGLCSNIQILNWIITWNLWFSD